MISSPEQDEWKLLPLPNNDECSAAQTRNNNQKHDQSIEGRKHTISVRDLNTQLRYVY